MMTRRDMADVVQRCDGLRQSCFDPLPPQSKTPRGATEGASPYKSGLRELREAGASTPRTPASGNKVRRLTRPSTGGLSSGTKLSKRFSMLPEGSRLEDRGVCVVECGSNAIYEALM